MKRIRIGKDISMRWEITTDGVAIPLDGRDLTIEIKSPAGIKNNIPYRVDGNVIIMTFYGYEQKRTGEYSITLWENKGKIGQNVVDVVRAFELVRTSQEEDDFVGGDLQIESVDLGTENFDILTEGGYRAINIDTLQAEALKDSVNIKGKTYSNESFTITLPKANLDSAGVMSASDVRTLKEHADSIAQIKTSCEENAADIERVSNVVDTHESRLGGIDAEISSLNTEVSALQSKVDENTTSISQINNNIADHDESITQINTKLEEHTESINAKITTDRIEDGAVTSEKIATTAFDSTLSVSGKIAPADVVGGKITKLEQEINGKEEIISIINQSRISKGWNLPSGKWKVEVTYISNPDLETTWQLFHYVNGAMGTKYIDEVSINDSIEVDIPLGEDGIWLFTTNVLYNNPRTLTFKATNKEGSVINDIKNIEGAVSNLKDNLNNIERDLYIQRETISIDTKFRVSVGWMLPPGNYIFSAKNNSQIDDRWRLYKYVGGSMESPLTELLSFQDKVRVNVESTDDGIWLFTEQKLSTQRNYNFIAELTSQNPIEKKINNLTFSGKKILCLGDSLTEFADKSKKRYSDYLAEITSAECINAGMGGTRIASRVATPQTQVLNQNQCYGWLDIVNLVKQWCANDFTQTNIAAGWLKDNASDDNTGIIERLSQYKPTDFDIVTIFAGTNDYAGASPFGNEDSVAINDLNGAIKNIIDDLLTANPKLHIIFFTPIVSYLDNIRDDEHWSDNFVGNGIIGQSGVKKPQFCENMENIVRKHHIPCKNWYYDLGWNRTNFSNFYSNPTDSTHPSGGFEWIARAMAAYLRGIL